MNIDVSKVDSQIRFLLGQAKGLRDRGAGAAWAERNAVAFDEIAELLRQLRQEKQMTGLGGKRLTE